MPQMHYNEQANINEGYGQNFVQQNTAQQNSGFNNMQNYSMPLSHSSSAMEKDSLEEEKTLPAKMRLPSHVKKTHFRSNSLTPIETRDNKFQRSAFMSEQINSGQPRYDGPHSMSFKDMKLTAFTPHVRARQYDSSSSIPALRSVGGESIYTESSVFDGNDSDAASMIDIRLDANGQPYFDNVSANGDSSFRGEGEEGSEEVSVKRQLIKPVAKKKSAF